MKAYLIPFLRKFLLAAGLTLLAGSSYATWSIIMIDAATNRIGMAGASCTYSVYGIGAIAPGQGAIIVQAMSNDAARAAGMRMILANASPEEIVQALMRPRFDPEKQQYAVITVKDMDKPATYTGSAAAGYKGALSGKGITVQGNILADAGELQAVFDAAIKARDQKLSLEETLMLALEAGAALGGDKRCGSRKASSAFLTVSDPGDPPGKPSLNLVVRGTDDHTPAVAELRKRFEEWRGIDN